MREVQRNLMVGLFVIFGMAALAVLILMYSKSAALSMAGDAYVLHVQLPSAEGIRPGTQATVGGIAVGRVRDVGFVDARDLGAGVDVEIAFNAGIEFHEGTTASTVEPGLGSGRPPIAMDPGPTDQPLLTSGATIVGEMTPAMASLVPPEIVSTLERTAVQIGGAAEAMTPVLRDLHGVLEARSVQSVDRVGGPEGNLATAAARLDLLLKNLNEVVGDDEARAQFVSAIKDLSKVSADGVELVAELRQTNTELQGAIKKGDALFTDAQVAVGKLDERLDNVTRGLTSALQRVGNLVDRVNLIVDKINRGEGTIGLFLTDARLYESLVQTFRKLADATLEFELLIQEWRKGKIRIGL